MLCEAAMKLRQGGCRTSKRAEPKIASADIIIVVSVLVVEYTGGRRGRFSTVQMHGAFIAYVIYVRIFYAIYIHLVYAIYI